jgi:hypothetical protein
MDPTKGDTTMAALLARKARAAALTVAAIAATASLALPAAADAQQKGAAAAKGEQFFPILVYRTGAYGPNGTPWANGFVDYLKLVNAQGGINGVKIAWEECETGYATDRGVECYERLKSRPFVAAVQPLSTGITFALTDKAPGDKIPLVTAGYGRSESIEGEVFPRRDGQAQGQEDRADLPRLALREGADSAADRAVQAARLRADDHSGHPSGRRAEGRLAADPPAASRLRVPVGLGRDELHRAA